MNRQSPATVRTTGWDRSAIVALGAAGCALSYDALQQMATAIHVRGLLTYLFPLVIDGFIAYGVRGLLVLRTAHLGARCYVWLLFSAATSASIWANALHAVRLNQQHPPGDGLRLGDLTVGVLSTLAPLALAGAVHLYILIARRATQDDDSGQAGAPTARPDRLPADRPVPGQHSVTAPTPQRPTVTGGKSTTAPRRRGTSATGKSPPREPGPEHGVAAPDLRGHPATRPTPANQPRRQTTPTPSGHPTRSTTPVADEVLHDLARRAVTEAGKATRQVVADAVRGQGHPLSNHRLTELMEQLRTGDPGQPDTPTG